MEKRRRPYLRISRTPRRVYSDAPRLSAQKLKTLLSEQEIGREIQLDAP